MKQSTAKDMFKLRDTVVELDQIETPQGGTGWNVIPGHKFPGPNVMLMRMHAYDNTRVQMVYFDERVGYEQGVVVPNEFMMKLAESNDKVKAIVDKYKAFQIRNLVSQVGFGCTSGSDPEMFVVNSKDELMPAFNFLGSKAKPTIAKGMIRGYKNNVYWDGFQAEFDVSANSCVAYMLDSIYDGLQGLLEAARKVDPGAKISHKTVFDISGPMLREAAPEHVAFGCMPSLNVYGMKGLETPGDQVYHRAAGGHIHLGNMHGPGNILKTQYPDIIKALDAILGVACVSLFAQFDDPRRRQMYGLAGEYRTPAHGLEYRVLSNSWLLHPLMANIVYDLARPAAGFGVRGFLKEYWKASEEETIRAINECNVDLARDILVRNKEIMLQLLRIKCGSHNNWVFDILMNGAESVLVDPTNIERNWCLTNNLWGAHCGTQGRNVSTAHGLYLVGITKV